MGTGPSVLWARPSPTRPIPTELREALVAGAQNFEIRLALFGIIDVRGNDAWPCTVNLPRSKAKFLAHIVFASDGVVTGE